MGRAGRSRPHPSGLQLLKCFMYLATQLQALGRRLSTAWGPCWALVPTGNTLFRVGAFATSRFGRSHQGLLCQRTPKRSPYSPSAGEPHLGLLQAAALRNGPSSPAGRDGSCDTGGGADEDEQQGPKTRDAARAAKNLCKEPETNPALPLHTRKRGFCSRRGSRSLPSPGTRTQGSPGTEDSLHA